jgi:hypothetical protein
MVVSLVTVYQNFGFALAGSLSAGNVSRFPA